jgi:3'(2'),5'-bisphosphate nucleotidase
MQDSSLINQLISISIAAGDILMKHREKGVEVDIKSDNSPVTEADKEADEFITKHLSEISKIKIVSEEGRKDSLPTESDFWLVDPLDGTKSFIKGESEFTVNIGLIQNNEAVLGVIYQPVTNKLWYVGADGSAYYRQGMKSDYAIYSSRHDDSKNSINDLKLQTTNKSINDELIVVASKSHLSKKTEQHLESLKVKSFRSAASSLKFCLVAQGDADYYPRLSPTMQWDTAAGHAILNAAGGSVCNPDGTPFKYIIDVNNIESLRNGSFIAKGWK